MIVNMIDMVSHLGSKTSPEDGVGKIQSSWSACAVPFAIAATLIARLAITSTAKISRLIRKMFASIASSSPDLLETSCIVRETGKFVMRIRRMKAMVKITAKLGIEPINLAVPVLVERLRTLSLATEELGPGSSILFVIEATSSAILKRKCSSKSSLCIILVK